MEGEDMGRRGEEGEGEKGEGGRGKEGKKKRERDSPPAWSSQNLGSAAHYSVAAS